MMWLFIGNRAPFEGGGMGVLKGSMGSREMT